MLILMRWSRLSTASGFSNIMQIKIYTKDYDELTTLVQTATASDFNALTYKETLMQVGQCSFVVRLDNSKVTLANLKHYNIVEVCEDDGSVRWVGVIVYRRVLFNTAQITCFSMLHLLTRRVTDAEDAFNDTAGTVAAALLDATNYIQDTQIAAGTFDDPGSVQLTFNRSSVFDALRQIADASGGQFMINPDRTLDFRMIVGTDLSASVVLQYRLSLIAAANILTFQVDDDGKAITTHTLGASAEMTSDEESTELGDEFGLLEEYKNFREYADQGTLDSATVDNNRGSELSPLLNLSPTVEDNFECGDIVRVILENRLVSIDDAYQITEKTVTVKGGGQRSISVRVISNTSDFFKQIRDLKRSVDLLQRSV